MAEIAFELRPFLNEQGQLISLPAKNKKKLLAIWYLAERIPARRTFTEAEINDAIDDQTTFRDHATLQPRALQPPSAGSHRTTERPIGRKRRN